uniref:Uncharacterized protein n=1 Tax=viral metagenome TaxID=1070528 RepID=A0A6M3Y676_9ZZZZ
MKNNCAVKNCKGAYGGWLDIFWGKGKHLKCGRIPLCKKHFNKVYPELEEMEKKECKKNEFWAFAPLEKVNEALNS